MSETKRMFCFTDCLKKRPHGQTPLVRLALSVFILRKLDEGKYDCLFWSMQHILLIDSFVSCKYKIQSDKKTKEMWPSGSDFEKQKRKDWGVIPYLVSLLFLQASWNVRVTAPKITSYCMNSYLINNRKRHSWAQQSHCLGKQTLGVARYRVFCFHCILEVKPVSTWLGLLNSAWKGGKKLPREANPCYHLSDQSKLLFFRL